MLYPIASHRRAAVTRRNAVVAILLSLTAAGLLAAVISNAQAVAAKQRSQNQLKLRGMACTSIDSSFERLPPLFGGGAKQRAADDYFIAGGSTKFAYIRGPTYVFLSPYISNELTYKTMHVGKGEDAYYTPAVVYRNGPPYSDYMYDTVSPSDPSHVEGRNPQGKSVDNYAANAQLFAATDKRGLITGELTGTSNQFDRGLAIAKIPDGSSNTIAFAEKYGSCGHGGSLWSAGISDTPIRGIPANTADDPYYWPVFGLARDRGNPDRAYGTDPSTLANTSETRLPFQVRPDWTVHKGVGDPLSAPGCDAYRAATPYATGILVAMADGSVRTIKPGIDPQVWFYLLYPDDGQQPSFD